MARYTRGDRVAILGTTLNGEIIIEGYATVQRTVDGSNHSYLVTFERDDAQEAVERFIDGAAQADPKTYVRELNARLKGAS